MNLFNLSEIHDGKRYTTKTATEIASNCYWDGHNWERSGRNTWLLKTPNGAFFLQRQTQWEAEQNRLEPLTEAEALNWYEQLSEHEVEYETAFGRECAEA